MWNMKKIYCVPTFLPQIKIPIYLITDNIKNANLLSESISQTQSQLAIHVTIDSLKNYNSCVHSTMILSNPISSIFEIMTTEQIPTLKN